MELVLVSCHRLVGAFLLIALVSPCSSAGLLLFRGSVPRCSMQHQRTGSEGNWRASITKSRQPTRLKWISR
ncbi:hypothetical protein Gotur_028327 [Gossypium turneri]